MTQSDSSSNNCSFLPLLRTRCTDIVNTILDDMQIPGHRFSVGKAIKTREIPVPNKPILYRWWFPEDSPVLKKIYEYIQEQKDKGNEEDKKDVEKLEKFLAEQVKQRSDLGDGKVYYALYFGKSIKGHKRLRQHIVGTARISTVRHTVFGLVYGEYNIANKEENERKIDEILQHCYCEWTDICDDANLVVCFESICIALGNYVLNIEGNPAITENWREKLLEVREKSNVKKKTKTN